MGKQKTETPGGALTRMNFLYQASYLMSKLSPNTCLTNYYGKIMKEVSKKTLEKIHPDLKRTMCSACNYSLTATSKQIDVKIKPHPRRKGKKLKNVIQQNVNGGKINETVQKMYKRNSSVAVCNKYKKSRIERRNLRPNKISYCCSRCSFTKDYFQKPNYELWIHKM